jgi:hypothetical protein
LPRRLRLYLDFDGVLTAPVRPSEPEVGLARHAYELLRLVVERCEPFWLTTRKNGVYRAFDEVCGDAELRRLVHGVPVASFVTMKVEALPNDGGFLWLDDAPLTYERAWLVERGLHDNLIQVNVRREPEAADFHRSRANAASVAVSQSSPRSRSVALRAGELHPQLFVLGRAAHGTWRNEWVVSSSTSRDRTGGRTRRDRRRDRAEPCTWSTISIDSSDPTTSGPCRLWEAH